MSSVSEGVVFFHKGDPITNPAPLMQEKVDRVTAVDHASVRVDNPEKAEGMKRGLKTLQKKEEPRNHNQMKKNSHWCIPQNDTRVPSKVMGADTLVIQATPT